MTSSKSCHCHGAGYVSDLGLPQSGEEIAEAVRKARTNQEARKIRKRKRRTNSLTRYFGFLLEVDFMSLESEWKSQRHQIC